MGDELEASQEMELERVQEAFEISAAAKPPPAVPAAEAPIHQMVPSWLECRA